MVSTHNLYSNPSPISHRHRTLSCRAAQNNLTTTATPTTSFSQLPADIRNTTAVLTSGDTIIYVLGVSHVSRNSCRHIEQLIDAVKPDTVFLELCKDRTGLLINETTPPNTWYAPQVNLIGWDTQKEGYPSKEDLLTLLAVSESKPVSVEDIERDVLTLLSTGLFKSVKPVTLEAPPTASPAFMLDKNNKFSTAAPLRCINYVVTERVLPKIIDFSFENSTLPPDKITQIRDMVLENRSNLPSLQLLLIARGQIQTALESTAASTCISFQGVETGNVIVILTNNTTNPRALNTGFEGSAVGGKGFGIDTFIPRSRQQQPVSTSAGGLKIEWNSKNNGAASNGGKNDPQNTASIRRHKNNNDDAVTIVPWNKTFPTPILENSKDDGAMGGALDKKSEEKKNSIADSFGTAITQQYAKYQAAAGRRVGIGTGSAWQVAVKAAAAAGTRYIFMADRPAPVTARRLSRQIWSASSPFLLGAVPASLASALIVSEAMLQVGAETGNAGFPIVPAVAAAVIPLAAALWPIVAPLIEVSQFSQKTPLEIENLVAVKGQLQNEDGSAAQAQVKLWGEDALLNWPGAMQPIIHERDEYMARAIAAAVTKRAEGFTPAYVKTVVNNADGDESIVYRYAMPIDADTIVAPQGTGDGTFVIEEGAIKTAVAVIGTAHVYGLIGAWNDFTSSSSSKNVKKNYDLSLRDFVL